MVKYQFETYARLKPTEERGRHESGYTMPYDIDHSSKVLEVFLPRSEKAGYVNNQKEVHRFSFSHVFDQDVTQEDVFRVVAEPLAESWLNGYNGTMFAYGQTGSGKTYTMSGADTWELRGLIPRVLTYIFEELEGRENLEYNIYVTYLEIYNENAYDLLESSHAEKPMEDWTKIQLYQDIYGNLHMKNMSVHQIYSEQDGIDLLMMGNFIRHVSTTPMNMASSRSHCVFTIAFECREIGSEVVRSSKLYLVDLAGSERISKSTISGQTLNEARHINLSLTYLEQVIIALHDRQKDQRAHIPYRNSFMTTILRDSLGGNCKTVLIANMNTELENIDESLSTAKFAMRCGKISTNVTVNEQIDINMTMQRLQQENEALKRQMRSREGSLLTTPIMSNEEAETCKRQVAMFLSESETPRLIISTSGQAFRCMQLFREVLKIKEEQYQEEIQKLQMMLDK